MGLKEIYESWAFKPGNILGANKTPRQQSEGRVAVDYLPNTYQTEVRNRLPGDKVVLQSSEDDQTNGTFKPDTAFKYYSSLIMNAFLTRYPRGGVGKVIHKYNAQGTDEEKYMTSSPIKNTPGALYSTNQ